MTDTINWKAARVLSDWLDALDDPTALPAEYRGTAAQDWARVAKTAEEVGEAISAYIGTTGQNRRKGYSNKWEHLYEELADVVLTGVYALHHFLDDDVVREVIANRQKLHHDRIGVAWPDE